MDPLVVAFLVCQSLVVLFIGLHDWIPLGRLNNLVGIRSVDSRRRLLVVTAISTLPFAIALAACAYYAASASLFPMWLFWFLWIGYGAAVYGMLRAWWIPYFLIPDPARAARYRERFARTHSFLPPRNGIRPDTLHVCFHAVLLVLIGLLVVLTRSRHAFGMG